MAVGVSIGWRGCGDQMAFTGFWCCMGRVGDYRTRALYTCCTLSNSIIRALISIHDETSYSHLSSLRETSSEGGEDEEFEESEKRSCH